MEKMEMAKGYKNMDEKNYELIKTLLDAGLTIKKAAAIAERSASTVAVIKRSESYEDYRAIVRSYFKSPSNTVEETAPAVEEPKDQEVQEVQHTHFNPDSANLARIATALERLADAWESTPNKRRLF